MQKLATCSDCDAVLAHDCGSKEAAPITITLSEAEELVQWVLECCAATRTFKAKDLLQQWQKKRGE